MTIIRTALIFLIVAFISSPAVAGSAKRGLAFAQKNCAVCHDIGLGGGSPNPRSPPFREIAQKYEPRDLEEALSEGIVVSHDMPMPQFELDPNDIEDLITYLEKLRREKNVKPSNKPRLIRRVSRE